MSASDRLSYDALFDTSSYSHVARDWISCTLAAAAVHFT